jgi:signal transduction histidine kinase
LQAQASLLTNPDGFHLGRLILLQDITEQRQAQARILNQQRALAMLQEREQLARELHDGISQGLAFVNVQAQAIELDLQSGQNEEAQASLARLAQVARDLQSDMRDLIGQLFSASLQSGGFGEALGQEVARFERQTDLTITMDIGGGADALDEAAVLPPATAVQLLRILQEALTNVRKHAGHPNEIRVEFAIEEGQARLTIADNGVGFDPALAGEAGEHFGLRGMSQRAETIGGRIAVQSALGQGTRIEVSAPIKRTSPARVAQEGGAHEDPAGR